MKSMNRQLSRLTLTRNGSGDTTNMVVLLNNYEEADTMLSKIIDACKAWRDSWASILSVQLGTTTVLQEIYKPILDSSDKNSTMPVITPSEKLDRISKLQEIHVDLKNDLLDEVKTIDSRVIKPAVDVKELIKPVRKIIKKRENKRLDWEICNNRLDGYSKKMKRTDRENSALTKAEEESTQAASVFKLIDDQLRDILPTVISAAFSILPHLLGAHIMIQTSLLAHYYTALHNYCEESQFPSTPPPMKDVVASWRSDFTSVQQKVEVINCISRGKAVHQLMSLHGDKTLVVNYNIENDTQNGQQNTNSFGSSQHSKSSLDTQLKHAPSTQSLTKTTIPSIKSYEYSTEPGTPSLKHPIYTSQNKSVSTNHSNSLLALQDDNFQRSAIAKKNKPPPPPPKRITAKKPIIYATALYSFEGESSEDLSFEIGDVITVIKKTGSTDDWWEGELRGRQGSFPANYCKFD